MKNKQSYDSYSRPSDSRLFQLYALLRWSLSKIQGTFASLYSGPTATIISNCLRTHFFNSYNG